MLGIKDPSIMIVFILLLLSSLTCIIYGIINWNKEGDVSEQQLKEEAKWAEEEREIDDELGGV